MSKYRKYVTGGGLNPFYVMEQQAKARREQEIQSCKDCVTAELEAKMEFLERYSGSSDKLELAKSILGII